jgi:hypothetical protein
MAARGQVEHMRLLLSFALLAISALPAGATNVPITGCAAWQRTIALTLAGTAEDGGLTAKFHELLDPRDGRTISTQDFGMFSEGAGFDGHVGWSKDRSGASHDLNADAAHAINTTEAWLFHRGWCRKHGALLEKLQDENDNGVVQSVWRATPKNGIPVILRFDAKRGLIRQAEYRLWGNRLIRHYDDWRDIGHGVMVAFSEKDEDPEDEDTRTIALSSATLGSKPFVDATFARPARPHDYKILGGAASTTVSYEDDGVARIYVPVYVDGKGPFAFELDTGGHLIIGDDLATTLGLKATGNFSNTGAGTAITRTGVAPDQEIRIGDAVISGQPANVRAFANDRIAGKPPRAGLIGLELFERFAVEVDRGKKTVTLTPLETFKSGAGTRLPIRFIEDAPLTEGAVNGVAGDFEIDSGNSGPTIIEGYWAHQNGFDTSLAKGLAWGAGSGAGFYPEWIKRSDIALGPIALAHQIVTYVGQPERGSEATRLQAGVSGEWALRCFDMTYDYGHGVVWLGPRHANCVEPPFNHAGVRLAKDKDGFTADAVVPNSPADAAGIKPGDRVVTIAGKDVAALTPRDAAALLAGPVGTSVDIRYIPKAGQDARDAHITLVKLVP